MLAPNSSSSLSGPWMQSGLSLQGSSQYVCCYLSGAISGDWSPVLVNLLVTLVGPASDERMPWSEVTSNLVKLNSEGEVERGIGASKTTKAAVSGFSGPQLGYSFAWDSL